MPRFGSFLVLEIIEDNFPQFHISRQGAKKCKVAKSVSLAERAASRQRKARTAGLFIQ
jgi:hypothetical protein